MNAGVDCPIPSPGDFPNPGIEPTSPELQTDSILPEPPGKPIFLQSPVKNTYDADTKAV